MSDDIDITADLTGGADDGFLADTNTGAVAAPPGTVQANSDAAVKAEPGAADASVSLRDQLSSAFKGEDGKPAAQADGVNAGDQNKPTLTQDEAGRYRNADGTYASAEQIAAFEAGKSLAASLTMSQPAAQAPDYSPLLSAMTPVEQVQFKSLPAETQQYVARTMEGLNNAKVRHEEYDFLEQQLIGNRRQAWADNGMSVPVALNNLLTLSDFATTKPGDFVLWFAQQNGLDLDALLDARDAQGATDPVVSQLQNTVATLQQQLTQVQQAPQQQLQQQRLDLVKSFTEEKDGAGALKRPYLPQVNQDWGTHIVAIRQANPNMPDAEVLEKAYDVACWANPTVRAHMQEAVTKSQNAARVAAARNAGASVTGAPAGAVPTSDPANPNLSLRDELRNQFAAARN